MNSDDLQTLLTDSKSIIEQHKEAMKAKGEDFSCSKYENKRDQPIQGFWLLY